MKKEKEMEKRQFKHTFRHGKHCERYVVKFMCKKINNKRKTEMN